MPGPGWLPRASGERFPSPPALPPPLDPQWPPLPEPYASQGWQPSHAGEQRGLQTSSPYAPLAVSPDGRWLAAVDIAGSAVSVLDVPGGRLRLRVNGSACAFTHDATALLVVRHHELLCIDLATHKETPLFVEPTGTVRFDGLHAWPGGPRAGSACACRLRTAATSL